MEKTILILNRKLMSSFQKNYFNFIKSTKNTEKEQKNHLMRIIRDNECSDFGKIHNFSKIKSIKGFQKCVPISDYSSYESYINQYSRKNKNILTAYKIKYFQPTSGSTGRRKLIPYTEELRKEFVEGISPWFYDLFSTHKALQEGTSYWQATPSMHQDKTLKSGLKIGFDNDSNYLGIKNARIIKKLFAVPEEAGEIKDFDSFRYVTQLFLVRDEKLAFVSVWHPSLFLILLKDLPINMHRIISDLEKRNISAVSGVSPVLRRRLIKKLKCSKERLKKLKALSNKNIYRSVFPNLSVVSCWGGSKSKDDIEKIKCIFPDVLIQPKGLIATEAFLSFPLCRLRYPVLSINSHFFEFMELSSKGAIKEQKPILAHRLKKGRSYIPLITTSGGVYRYNLNDIIKVRGYYNSAPLIEFIGRYGIISDSVGEKLNETFVRKSIEKVFRKLGVSSNFYILAPENEKAYYYVLFIKHGKKITKNLGKALDKMLRTSYHYNYARKTGQLKPVRVFTITKGGAEDYFSHIARKGIHYGDVKILALSKETGLTKIFKGTYL